MSLKLYIEPTSTGQAWTDVITQHIPHTRCDIADEADFIVSTKIPYGSTDVTFIQHVLHSYEHSKQRVLVFLLSDYNEPLDVPLNVLLFRAGMYRSHKKNKRILDSLCVGEGRTSGSR